MSNCRISGKTRIPLTISQKPLTAIANFCKPKQLPDIMITSYSIRPTAAPPPQPTNHKLHHRSTSPLPTLNHPPKPQHHSTIPFTFPTSDSLPPFHCYHRPKVRKESGSTVSFLVLSATFEAGVKAERTREQAPPILHPSHSASRL